MEVGDTEGDTRGRLVWLTDAGTSMHSGVAREPDNTYGRWEQIGVMFGRGIPVYQKKVRIRNQKSQRAPKFQSCQVSLAAGSSYWIKLLRSLNLMLPLPDPRIPGLMSTKTSRQ